jgi:hypothetical protein
MLTTRQFQGYFNSALAKSSVGILTPHYYPKARNASLMLVFYYVESAHLNYGGLDEANFGWAVS